MPDPSPVRQADHWHAEIRRRLVPLALQPTREMEIVEEIGPHLEDRYTGLRALGTSEEEAAARAWRELDESDALGRAISSLESPAPVHLLPPGAAPGGGWLGTVWHDIRYSARTLRNSPAFSVTVLLAVALSIGPLTAILSVGNWLLWRPHPGVTDARSLAVVWFGQWRQSGASVSFSPSGVSYENLADIRSRARSITGIAGVIESTPSLFVPGGQPRQIGAELVIGASAPTKTAARSARRSWSSATGLRSLHSGLRQSPWAGPSRSTASRSRSSGWRRRRFAAPRTPAASRPG